MNAPSRLLPYLLACALTTSLAGEDQDIYVNVPRDVIAQVPDITTVTKVRFFVSADLGKSWQLLKDIPVAEGALTPPRYEFRPQSDGHYLIATAASFKSGAPQADPSPGAIPANALHLVVDTFKPVVAQFTARLDHVQPDQALVAVLWSATDANFGPDPVVIEASIDNGISWPVNESAPAQGAQKLLVPLAPKSLSVLVRITAKDLAGNDITSDPQTVALPPPPDPAVELAKAVNSLPAVNEIPTASLLPAPVPAADAATATATTPATGSSDATSATPGASDATTTSTGTAASTTASTSTASTPPAHPDVVAPHASDSALSHPADGGLISGTSFEKEYLDHSASADAPASPAAPAAAPVSSGPEDATSGEGADTMPEVPVAAAKAVAGPAPVGTSATEEQPSFLTNPAAATVLEEARSQVAANDTTGALATYHRLQSSGQAVIAIREELALMSRLGFQQMIVNTVSLLPPEFIDDHARLCEGRALVQLAKPQVALDILARVHAGASEASESMFLIAHCLKDLGHPAQAKRVLKTLAAGDDEWAERARASLPRSE
jgi:hypothetical protein